MDIGGLILIPASAFFIHMILKKKLMGDKCSNLRPAIVYKSFEGEWHAILFKNREYAELFAKANDGRLEPTPFHEAPLF